MKKPRFQLGDRLYHSGSEGYVRVVEIINKADAVDVRTQGYRYEARGADGSLWSIPESALFANKENRALN